MRILYGGDPITTAGMTVSRNPIFGVIPGRITNNLKGDKRIPNSGNANDVSTKLYYKEHPNNGIELLALNQNSASGIHREAKMDADNGYLYTEITVVGDWLVNIGASSYYARAAGTALQGLASTVTTDAMLRHLLMQPRRRLTMLAASNIDLNLFGNDAEEIMYDVPAYPYDRDAAGGPEPLVFDILEILGAATFVCRWGVRFCINECGRYGNSKDNPPVLVSNRYTTRVGYTETYGERRYVEGEAIFRTDELIRRNLSADQLRALLVMPIPKGYIRYPIEVQLSSGGNGVKYSYVDSQSEHNYYIDVPITKAGFAAAALPDRIPAAIDGPLGVGARPRHIANIDVQYQLGYGVDADSLQATNSVLQNLANYQFAIGEKGNPLRRAGRLAAERLNKIPVIGKFLAAPINIAGVASDLAIAGLAGLAGLEPAFPTLTEGISVTVKMTPDGASQRGYLAALAIAFGKINPVGFFNDTIKFPAPRNLKVVHDVKARVVQVTLTATFNALVFPQTVAGAAGKLMSCVDDFLYGGNIPVAFFDAALPVNGLIAELWGGNDAIPGGGNAVIAAKKLPDDGMVLLSPYKCGQPGPGYDGISRSNTLLSLVAQALGQSCSYPAEPENHYYGAAATQLPKPEYTSAGAQRQPLAPKVDDLAGI